MNLYKIALSLLITAAPAAARLSSDEKDSSAVMRELMEKVDAIQADNEALKADNKFLKNEVGPSTSAGALWLIWKAWICLILTLRI